MTSSERFTHLDEHGHARMVDVNAKPQTLRRATAGATVRADVAVDSYLDADDLHAAQVAGIQGARRTPFLIPLCHPIPLGDVHVAVELADGKANIFAETEAIWRTGVEMEALTAVTLAALSLVTSLSTTGVKGRIDDVAVWRKSGGRSGAWGRAVP